jgi:hypothetical protein
LVANRDCAKEEVRHKIRRYSGKREFFKGRRDWLVPKDPGDLLAPALNDNN